MSTFGTPQAQARWAVLEIVNQRLFESDRASVTYDDVKVVTQTYILGHWKAMVMVVGLDDYFEVTYRKGSRSVFVDSYTKTSNVEIPLDPFVYNPFDYNH